MSTTTVTTILMTPDTSDDVLRALTGQSVEIDKSGIDTGIRCADVIRCVVTGPTWHMSISPGIGTNVREEPHGACRGGWTVAYIPYGATVRILGTTDLP